MGEWSLLPQVKNSRTIQFINAQSGRGHIQEARGLDHGDSTGTEKFGILEKWSLRGGGRTWRFKRTG